MAAVPASPSDLRSVLLQFYPSAKLAVPVASSASSESLVQVSQSLFPDLTYTDAELTEIKTWLDKSRNLASIPHDSPELKDANTYLATRTTILGSKPSVSDITLYSALSIHVRTWSPEQRTGEFGHHHIIRYLDFVQSAPVFGLTIPESAHVPINSDEILCYPKALDPKEEKEKKKKEKAAAAAAAAAAGAAVTTASAKAIPDRSTAGGLVEHTKEVVYAATEAVKSKGAELAAAAGSTSQSQKKEKRPKQPKPPTVPEKAIGPNLIDLRIGHILKCEKHPDADSLFVSTMDVGDAEGTKDTWVHESGKVVRTVCSGLNGLVPLEAMQGRRVVAVCNLKPVKMRGILSCAMVLAASPRLAPGEEDNHAGPVELVEVPHGPPAGTRISFEGFEGEPEAQLNPKKKVWEALQIGFTTLVGDGTVAFERGRTEILAGDNGSGKPVVSKLHVQGAGTCTVPTLRDAVVR